MDKIYRKVSQFTFILVKMQQNIDSVNKLIVYLEDELNTEPGDVIFADSICSDDVNSIQYPAREKEFLVPFKLNGLDGFPFSGLSGTAALASHIPDKGADFIYYGPHIGITNDGTIGEIHRFGQQKNSGCCGAAKGALAKLKGNQITEGKVTELDYQMNIIEQVLFKQKDRVLNVKTPLYEATEVIYEAIDQRINELVEKPGTIAGIKSFWVQYLSTVTANWVPLQQLDILMWWT